MRLLALFAIFATTLLSAGFVDPTPQITKASEIQNLEDEHWVILDGHILNQIGHNNYVFNDGSRDITVDIDDELWQGRDITPQMRVRIYGEVDQSKQKVEVKARKLILLP